MAAVLLPVCTPQAVHTQATDTVRTEPINPQNIAHERALMELLVAVAVPGNRLCREITFGIGVRERVEAESLSMNVDARQVTVKITRVGQGPLMIAGREAKLRDTLVDNPLDWVPCR